MRSILYRGLAWMAAWFAAPWALYHQRIIRTKGRALSDEEREIASQLGIRLIDGTFVMVVDRVPNPLRWSFGLMEKCSSACVSEVDGITLGHGIYVARRASESIELMAHELVHVGQYERSGSVWSFMVEYIHQCLMWGYCDAAWEVEARGASMTALDAINH